MRFPGTTGTRCPGDKCWNSMECKDHEQGRGSIRQFFGRHPKADCIANFGYNTAFLVRVLLGQMDLLRNLSPAKRKLISDLKSRHERFAKRGRIRKLLGNPYRFLESEYSVRTGTLLHRDADTFWGGSMEVNLPEPVSTMLYRYGYFEEGLSALFVAILANGGKFLDVGSHYGYFSLLARHLVGASGGVVALEPTPSTFQANRLNTSKFDNIRVENKAAWSTPTTARLTDLGVAWSSHNSLMSPKMIPSGVRQTARQIDVECLRLDDFLAEIGFAPDLIKIDAESAELEILKGLSHVLRTLRPVITLEVGDEEGGAAVRSSDAVNYCAEHGYVPFTFVDWAILPHEVQTCYGYDNVFMVPSERATQLA
jgi:FkbM family methyltransferase